MTEIILEHEAQIRLGAFLGVLLAMMGWEVLSPRRDRSFSRWIRWTGNLGIVVLNTVAMRLLFPAAAVGMAWFAQENGWGLFNVVDFNPLLEIVIAAVLLDMIIYFQHVLFHAVPVLWRLHRMHHADLDFDVTTGLRFHPVEIILSMVVKLAAVAALGPHAIAVIIFEVLLNGTAMFNHGNVRLPLGLDRILRWVVVTPDMHRVHHSVVAHETNSNFGFNLPWWDRAFGTYRDQPAAGHEGMTIGIEAFREAKCLRLDWLLIQPFLGPTGNYPINRPDGAESQDRH